VHEATKRGRVVKGGDSQRKKVRMLGVKDALVQMVQELEAKWGRDRVISYWRGKPTSAEELNLLWDP